MITPQELKAQYGPLGLSDSGTIFVGGFVLAKIQEDGTLQNHYPQPLHEPLLKVALLEFLSDPENTIEDRYAPWIDDYLHSTTP
ncbi:hypothetical protein [Deinococcus roseus]|uniref:Uncharacterized protein n=1 Tax=Deinococcus roseus TaxID=392414 RepID=A0ABQ2DGD7_9DEIO|nr:hypothetical protein [Deinococcus roseus]GGJ55688.1 hypothetical protein GCM10008938_47330 [Deinococcus roseus]